MTYYENSRSGAMISDPGGGWVMRADCKALASRVAELEAQAKQLERERDAAIYTAWIVCGDDHECDCDEDAVAQTLALVVLDGLPPHGGRVVRDIRAAAAITPTEEGG
jgi:hypothetical protein